ncbi:hypothetical protein NC653_005930 [Populus alba x Populus x berolinensis]|uniref:60S ribosomal protein L41 n=1 Tax=Populus alba x Populus x berolinensis TaxID=444605 RepID=A0AAD6RDC2_9ROSI|nr:hypothetical protein NC653_005930 [Populus alba x Populus x berolinensis]
MAKGFKKLEVSTAITMRTKWKKKCMGRLKRERRKIRQRFKYIFSFSIMLDIERGFWDKHGTLSSQESRTFVNLGVVLNISMTGHESDRVSFDFFVWSGKYVECLLLGQKSRVASSLGRLSPFHSLSLLIYISFGIVHRTPCSSLSFELKSPSDISFFAVFQLQLILFSYRLESSSLVSNGFSPFIFSKQVCQYRKKTGLESSKGLAPLDYGDLFLWSGAMALLKISPLYQTTDRICYGTE